ncbi:MAG TPA: DinB family protein [Thermoanaerobaculia bacterium]|nr:DinB family protein [Thermoanaerobaculia bacterium]
MQSLDDIRRLFAYDAWANRETLASLRSASSRSAPPEQALRWMAHIAATEGLWLSRILADGERVVVWPELTLGECEERTAAMARRWTVYLDGITSGELPRAVTYVNSQGEPWTSTVADILTHTVMHSVHHRAQIAAELRRHGHTPAYTDFIHAVRRGFVE